MSYIASPLAEAERKVTGDALQGALVDLINLSLAAKQFHWNLVGPRFRSVHLELDEIVALARTHADTVAERAVALGVNPDGRPGTIASDADITPNNSGWISDDAVLKETATLLRKAGEKMRARIDAVEQADPVSQDLLIDVAKDLEKQAWMFEAQMAQVG